MKLKLSEIEKDDDIYPRQQMSRKTIESYADAIWAGAKFPPVEVQRVRIVDEDFEMMAEEKTICLDGWHRIEACRLYNGFLDVEPIEEIDVVFWKKEVLDKAKHLNELRLKSAFLNIAHGDRLSVSDRKEQARRIVELNPAITNSVLIEHFGVSKTTIISWVKDIRSRFYATRDSLIHKLSLLGWIQEDIADGIEDVTQERVSQIISKVKDLTLLIKRDFYKEEKPIEDVCEYHGLDEQTTWALLLEEKSDEERFEIFGNSEYSNDKPKIYDVWNFLAKDPRFNTNYPGFLFGQVLMNVLYRWCESKPRTKKLPLVVDPMAGGGSIVDACLIMGKRCKAYDIKSSRPEIVEHDIRDGFPEQAKGCDLIFLDPPYHKKKEGDYNCPEITKSRESFIDFMQKLAKDSFDTVREGGHVALIYGNYVDYDDTVKSVFAPELYRLFIDAGFECAMAIQTPLSGSAQYQARDVTYAREHNRVLTISRDLYIFRKPTQ